MKAAKVCSSVETLGASAVVGVTTRIDCGDANRRCLFMTSFSAWYQNHYDLANKTLKQLVLNYND